jgi:hypothetical protein
VNVGAQATVDPWENRLRHILHPIPCTHVDFTLISLTERVGYVLSVSKLNVAGESQDWNPQYVMRVAFPENRHCLFGRPGNGVMEYVRQRKGPGAPRAPGCTPGALDSQYFSFSFFGTLWWSCWLAFAVLQAGYPVTVGCQAYI